MKNIGTSLIALAPLAGLLFSSADARAQTPPFLNQGLVAYYPFNGDASEALTGRPSVVYSATLTTDRFGNANSAYSFPGGGSIAYINLGPDLLKDGASDQTITWWERIPFDGGGVFLSGYVPNDYWFLQANVRADGPFYRMGFEAFLKLSGATDWVPTSPEWTHGAVVFHGANSTEFFRDGVLIASAPGIPRNPGQLFLGARVYSFPDSNGGAAGGVFANSFSGELDDIRVFDHALSATEMEQVFSDGGPFLSQTIGFAPIPDFPFSTNTVTLSATSSSGLAVPFHVVSGPGTLTGNQLTVTNIGSITVSAEQAGTAKFLPAAAVLRSFTVIPGAQVIDFPALNDVFYSAKTVTLSASASSGLPVSFALVSGPATIEGNVLTFTGIGTVSITASSAGNTTFLEATPVTRSFSVSKASQNISFDGPSDQGYSPDPILLTASASSGLPVRFTVLSSPAVLDGNSLSLRGAGKIWLEAWQDGNENYAEASPQIRSFTVTLPPVGPNAFYPFNGNANEALTGRPSVVVGATLTTDRFGNPNSAYRFSTNRLTYINLGPGLLQDGTSDQTITWWQARGKRVSGAPLSGYGAEGSWHLSYETFDTETGFYRINISDANFSPLLPTDSEWEQFALVLRGSSTGEIYRNGARLPIDTTTGSPWRQAGDLYLGVAVHSFPDPNGGADGGLFLAPFEGDLDDIRIFDKALTASEIRDLYLQETPIQPPVPPPLDPAFPVGLTNGLVAWYPLNGDAWDASGSGNHGVVIRALATADRFGRDAKALRFPPGSQAVVMIPGQFIPNNPMTVSLWVRLENPSLPPGQGFSGYPVFSGQGHGFNDWNFHLNLQGNGKDISPVLEVMNSSGIFGEYATWNLFSDDNGIGDALNWHHIAIAVENSTTATLYLDGAKVTWGPAENGFQRSPSELFYIGWAPRSQGFGGSLDDVRIYNRALSEIEILQLNKFDTSLP